MNFYDLKETQATKAKFDSYIRKNSPNLVVINAHGNELQLAGHNNDIIIDANSRVPNAVLYARSCDAGAALGQKLVDNGAKAFIGYKRKFTLCFLGEYATRPLHDPIAKYFLESSNLIPTTVMKGNTVAEAHKRSKTQMLKDFRKMLSSEATDDERWAARWVFANMSNQVLLGDPNARAV